MDYKRILVCPSGRINLNDTTNNGLLFRNLFKSWPKDKIAQIFNSGNNGDIGFFYKYYQFTAKDRRFGYLYSLINKRNTFYYTSDNENFQPNTRVITFNYIIKKVFIESGLYELIFRPRLSNELKKWLDDFKPELILIQGYSLTFTEFPLLFKKYTNAKLIFFTTDDWPKYLYNGNLGEYRLLSLLPRLKVNKIVKELIRETDIPVAFGYSMKIEYTKRYGKNFNSIIHCDDPQRFELSQPIRLHEKSIFSIVTIGTFNKYRWPLLSDIDSCCEELHKEGINAKVAVISNAVDIEGKDAISKMKNIEIYKDPGSDTLLSFLKAADILLLVEGFDKNFANSIELSISTKAHLYMFSKVPILVYANSSTGIAKYAKEYKWAELVEQQDKFLLKNSIMKIYNNDKFKNELVKNALEVALLFHDINKVQLDFHQLLNE